MNIEHHYRAITTDGIITEIQEPNGLITKINWESGGTFGGPTIRRISTVERNDNFRLVYYYLSNSAYDGYDWLRPSAIYGHNTRYSFST
jgi:hypothetical protein